MNERQIDKLLVAIGRGDNDAFAELYDKTKCGVFSFLYSYLQNYEDTRDALQNVYLKIKLNIDKYTPESNGKAWILQIAKNIALNEIYARKNTVDIDSVEIPSQTEFSEGIIEIMREHLSEDEQRIISLHVIWGLKHREIAQQLNCPTGTVTSKYKRSLAKLKSALKEAAL